jgi:phospholipid/cholesterol/gamma-HCH transport system substrate-binding protein
MMKMHYSHSLSSTRISQIVGAFVVLPLLGLIVVGIFMAKAEHLFEPKYVLRTNLSKSYGLEPGAPVLVAGIPIGKVQGVDFNDQGTITVLLQIRKRYQEMVRQDSEARVAKSGLLVGQTQVDISMGAKDKLILPDGATIQANEPEDYAELLNKIKPMVQSLEQALPRVVEVTKTIQVMVETGERVLANIEQETRKLPAVVDSVQRTVASVEKKDLPRISESLKKTLSLANGSVAEIRESSKRLPEILDAAKDAVNNVKSITETIKGTSKDIPPLVQTTHETMGDVQTIVRGAKRTFPVSVFVKNAGSQHVDKGDNGLRSLRGEQPGP